MRMIKRTNDARSLASTISRYWTGCRNPSTNDVLSVCMFVLQLKSKSPSWSSRSYSRSLAAALPAMLSRGLMASKLLSWAVLSTSDEDTRLSYRDLASPYISSCKRTFPVPVLGDQLCQWKVRWWKLNLLIYMLVFMEWANLERAKILFRKYWSLKSWVISIWPL